MSDDLAKRLRSKTPNMTLGHNTMEEAADLIEELEAKLAKAVEALKDAEMKHAANGEETKGKLQELVNRYKAHKKACKYAAQFFDIQNKNTIQYLREPYLAPSAVLSDMIGEGLSTVYRTPTRKGIESVWPVYYAKYVTEVLSRNGVDADTSMWHESELKDTTQILKNEK